jgi:hypothetical protein
MTKHFSYVIEVRSNTVNKKGAFSSTFFVYLNAGLYILHVIVFEHIIWYTRPFVGVVTGEAYVFNAYLAGEETGCG